MIDFGLAEDKKLIQQALENLRKTHPSIRCNIEVTYSNPVNQLVTNADRADVRFTYQGKPVKAQKVIVGGSIARSTNIAINETSRVESTGIRSNGIQILGGNNNPMWVELDAEIEWISIGLLSTVGGQTITVGKPPPTGISATAFGGHICIYAWTIPQADMLETE